MRSPGASAEIYDLARGVAGLAPGLGWLPESRVLLVADAHLAYEDVVGGALPLWSTAEIVATLSLACQRMGAREFVFLGDIVHGATMSSGAMRAVRAALDALRECATVTLVAGNHEGRSRAFAVLGETVRECERDGWLLVHGDAAPSLGRRAVIGHLHPSLHLGGRQTAPAFVACERLVVIPALTPYSPGLDVLSREFAHAIGAWAVPRTEPHVVVTTAERVYPFGALDRLAALTRARPARAQAPAFVRRRRLGADG